MKKVYEYKITFVIHSSRFEFDSMKRQSLMHVCKKRMKIGAWHIYIWGSTLKCTLLHEIAKITHLRGSMDHNLDNCML